jgi:hypothetical protein
MPVVRFPWNAQLIDLRRAAAPHARWDRAARSWTMTAEEAKAFLTVSHARLDFARISSEVTVDGTVWIIGFKSGAPCRREAT